MMPLFRYNWCYVVAVVESGFGRVTVVVVVVIVPMVVMVVVLQWGLP